MQIEGSDPGEKEGGSRRITRHRSTTPGVFNAIKYEIAMFKECS